MLWAASAGDLTYVDQFINRNGDVNYRDDEVKFVSSFGSVCIFSSFGLVVCAVCVCMCVCYCVCVCVCVCIVVVCIKFSNNRSHVVSSGCWRSV